MKNVFIIGAQRCGTTFLTEAMCAHPEIIRVNESAIEPKTYLNDVWPKSQIEYNAMHGIEVDGHSYCLEKSTSYYENWHVAERIYNSLSDPKIIFIVRNPFERLISNYEFSKTNGVESLELAKALVLPNREYDTSVNPYHYILRSLYSYHLIYWASLFKKNLKVIFFEEMVENQTKITKDVFSWLQLESSDEVNDTISHLDAINGVSRATNIPNFGNLDDSLRFLFDREKQSLEVIAGRTIGFWEF